jgi:peptide chain release factor 1
MFQKLDEVEAHYQDIEMRLTSPDIAANQIQFQKLSKEHSSLQPIVFTYRELRKMKQDFQQNLQIIREETGELKELALQENTELEPEIEKLERRLKILLLPRDPNDDKNTLLEIRAGAGGDEAGIFVGDLFRMYSKFAENRGWTVEVMTASPNDVGGLREIIAMIRGDKVYSQMKHESGVHRVQRVPKTETQGRIHTSTVTVAVLPEAEDVEVNIDPNDLRIDVFRSSGPGGQSVNTTDSAVRITHLPTNLVVVCRDEKSQHKNKAKALKVLKTRLLDMKQQEQHDKIAADRQGQVGTGDRSEKIRTYNFPQGRVTDHRIGVTLYQLDHFMSGGVGDMISQLSAFYEAEALKSQTSHSSPEPKADERRG